MNYRPMTGEDGTVRFAYTPVAMWEWLGERSSPEERFRNFTNIFWPGPALQAFHRAADLNLTALLAAHGPPVQSVCSAQCAPGEVKVKAFFRSTNENSTFSYIRRGIINDFEVALYCTHSLRLCFQLYSLRFRFN